MHSTLQRLVLDILERNKGITVQQQIDEETLIFRSSDSNLNEIRLKDRKQALYWVSICRLIAVAEVYEELHPLPEWGNKYFYFFTDLGVLNYFYSQMPPVGLPAFKGALAENFVYLYLFSQLKDRYKETEVHSYVSASGQVDFVLHGKDGTSWGYEVKYKKGDTSAGDEALRQEKLDYLVKFQDTYGSIGKNKATIPIFMIDKLKYVTEELTQ
jgi:hypothetical protein